MTATHQVNIDRLFHALSDPNRRGIVERLSRGPASVKELAEPFKIALPSVLKHLRVLEEGGIVFSCKTGRVRTYRIEPTAFTAMEEWIEARRAMWHRQFDRPANHVAQPAGAPQKASRKWPGASWSM